MNDAQLELFITIADAGSFTRASQTAYITKQAMIKQIRNLEDELGCTLFVRTKHGLILTQQGKIFYEGTKKILKEKNELVISILETKKQNVLRIGTVEHQVLLREVTDIFARKYPDIHLQYVVHPNHSGEYRVENDIQDIGESFINDTPVEEMHYEFLPLLNCRYSAIMDPSHPLAEKETVSLEDISRYPLTYFPWMVVREYRERISEEYRLHLQDLTVTNDVDHQVDIIFSVLHTNHIVLEANPVMKNLNGLRCIPLQEGWQRTYGMIYRRNPSFITRLYIDTARAVFMNQKSDASDTR